MLRLGRFGALGACSLVALLACSSGPGSSAGPGGGGSSAPAPGGAAGSATAGSTATGSGGNAGTSSGPAPSSGGNASGGAGGAPPSSAGSSNGGTATGGGGSVADTVTRTASTYKFRHFAIETNADGVWSGGEQPTGQPIETSYDTTILENAYLRVTILPSYGGRVLSIVHKPTNRELLYQNPIGTPYLMKQSIFYYDYLVIMGGIFASFPEPEHGRYWNQPYDFQVVSEDPQAITVRMSRKDDRDIAAGVPSRYDVGRTDVQVQVDVTLRAGSAALELSTKLTNTRTTAVPNFEYWTVTTLAPGSTPGQTSIPLNTRILANTDKVHLLESQFMWFADAEERVADEVFKWKNLSDFKNWKDQGTGFANPQYSSNWSGLANLDKATTYLRVSDNVETPGLKLWTFGPQSLTEDINQGPNWLRPTIEMWHGVTPEFWKRRSFAAGESHSWTDHYFAAFNLPQITAASEHGAIYLSTSDGALNVAAALTEPNVPIKAIFRLDGTVVAQQDAVAAAADATKLSATVPTSMLSAGAKYEAELLQGDKSLVKGQITLN